MEDYEGKLYMPGIVLQHPNGNIDKVKTAPWTLLTKLLGEDGESILTSLFLDCGIFTRLKSGKDNYFQVSGIPISELSKRDVKDGTSIKTKIPDVSSTKILKPSQISFVRNRMLYAKCSLNGQSRVRFGMKHIHALNRYTNPFSGDDIASLLKYIFPRQFELHNVFTSVVDSKETAQPFKDYTLREHEIQKQIRHSKSWVPRRLRGGIVNFVRRLEVRHRSCPYVQLLRHYCSISKYGSVAMRNVKASHQQKTPILSPELVTQLDDVPSTATLTMACSKQVDVVDTAGSFLRYSTPTAQVSAFCQSVIKHLLPADAFGTGEPGKKNARAIQYNIDRFICMRRFESLTLHEVVQHQQLRAIAWLRPNLVSDNANLSGTDRKKREELFNEFVYYLFDSLLVPLIRSNFYVTESSTERNRLFYFRHDVWLKLSEPALATLRLNMYTPLSAREIRRTAAFRTLGFGRVRLMPKDSGIRPITNLRRRTMKLVGGRHVLGSSINAQLAPAFSVLNYERLQHPDKLASALLSVGDIYSRLTHFKSSLTDIQSKKLYFIKVDVTSCFDTIPQGELLRLVNSLLSHDQYRTTRYLESRVVGTADQPGTVRHIKRFIGTARFADDGPAFSETVAVEKAQRKTRAIFTDTGNQKVWQARHITKLVREHVQNNIIKIGKKHYRQKQGIPQGSILSSLLCSYFYAEFEQQRLSFLTAQSSLLLRLIDDFLLITTNEKHARRFLQTMADGDADYGIRINPEKSLANFEVTANGHKIPRHHGSGHFPYCGLVINERSLALSKDRGRKDPCISNTLTVDVSGKAAAMFCRRTVSSFKLQLHRMLLDEALNGHDQTVLSLMGCFTEAAMKMHRYILSLPHHRRPHQSLIIDVIQQLVSTGVRVSLQVSTSCGQKHSTLSRSQISWTAGAAMTWVLEAKQTQYKQILLWLNNLQTSCSPAMRKQQGALTKLVEDNKKLFRNYVY